MYLITCNHKDCNNSKFYINPKAGKILLLEGVNQSGTASVQSAENTNENEKINIFLDTITSEMQNLDDKTISTLRIKINNFLSEQLSNSALPTISELDSANDYLVVRCPNGHKNYILLEDI